MEKRIIRGNGGSPGPIRELDIPCPVRKENMNQVNCEIKLRDINAEQLRKIIEELKKSELQIGAVTIKFDLTN